MRNINVLIEHNVDVKKAIELLQSVELYNEKIDEFQNNLETLNDQINNAMFERNLIKYAKCTEELKKETKQLGFNDLATIALKHEINAKTNDYEYIGNNYDELLMSIEKVTEIIKKYQESNIENTIFEPKENTKKILIADVQMETLIK